MPNPFICLLFILLVGAKLLHVKPSLNISFKNYVYLFAYLACERVRACVGRRTIFWCQFSLSIMWVLGTEFRLAINHLYLPSSSMTPLYLEMNGP